jgi:hypothetical protein
VRRPSQSRRLCYAENHIGLAKNMRKPPLSGFPTVAPRLCVSTGRFVTSGHEGRPYVFTTALKLLDDFWREVKRTLDEKGIPSDL